jgi:chromosome segregation protein
LHLKTITIQGFKTFARKTDLELEPGITAIVGPNGSGKSNLVDAIRWVLGERSARELRGARMEEVVYSGGARRAASGMAEVRLVIDNSDGRLPVPYTEVEEMRRGYRSGESDFWLNGGRCRLKDIEELFASTGLTQQGYAVVAQDDVDHIIQTTAAERRALIEEAAGVRGLRAKRQEAVNKLREADISIVRLNDVVHELSPRVEELRVQAEQAQRHQELDLELTQLRGSLLRGEWLAARQRQSRAAHRVEALRRAVEDARTESDRFAADYEQHKERLAAAHDARLLRERELGRLRLGLHHAESQAQLLAERELAAISALDQAEAALTEARARLDTLRGEPESGPAVDLATQQDQARRSLEAAATRLAQAQREHQQAATDEEVARRARADLGAHLERLEERVASLGLLAPADTRPSGAARRLADLIEVPDRLRPALEATLGRDLLDAWVAEGAAEEKALEAWAAAEGSEGVALLASSAAHAATIPAPPIAEAEPLVSLIRVPAWLEPALASLLADTWLVPDSAAAARLAAAQPQAMAVTVAGRARRGFRLVSHPAARTLEVALRLRQAEEELARARAAAVAADEGEKLARGSAVAAAEALETARQDHEAWVAQQLAVTARLEATQGRTERSATLQARQQAEAERLLARVEELRAARSEAEARLAIANAEADAARGALEGIPDEPEVVELESLTARLVEMEKGHVERRVALAHQEEALGAAEIQLATEAQAVAERSGQMGGDPAGVEGEEVDWEKTQRQIGRIERQIAQLGMVNLLAIEEYARDQARLSGIAGQLGDLAAARADLDALAAALTAEIERRFEAVFGAVAFNFQETFGSLFDGGKATLKLDDPTGDEPGVDILAQPAGKRMRSIRLLSGGERALTALAFILALERVTPSPFYIFDEVDAPLDDANVKRFNNMLQSMAAENQFVLVTHNHITMTSARALYGVTLEDSGVSRVVSVRLQGSEVVAAEAAG